MFTIEMLPAAQGDCLWIEYGEPSNPKRILIDGGVRGTYPLLKQRILALPLEKRRFELMVITHVDRDHIEGIVRLLNDQSLQFVVDDVWFNGYMHLVYPDRSINAIDEKDPDDLLGPKQGEFLSALIVQRCIKKKWNRAFGGKAVCITEDNLPTVQLDGGMSLTLLSPTVGALQKFIPVWEKDLRGKFEPGDFDAALEALAHRTDLQPDDDLLGEHDIRIESLAQTPFQPDGSVANGTSIAFIASYKGRTCLFAGDAQVPIMLDSIDRLREERRLKLDAFKLSHHGGKKNLSSALLDAIDCRNYLISTNSTMYRPPHPHHETIARIIRYGGDRPTLTFNYHSEQADLWSEAGLIQGPGGRERYEVVFPELSESGLCVDLNPE